VRIAIVAPLVSPIREPQRGGSQAFLAELTRGLAARGHDVHLYAACGSAVEGVEVVDTGVDHRELAATLYRPSGGVGVPDVGPSVAERAFAHVYELISERGYDVVHNHAFDAPAVALASTLNAPIVHTLHLPPDDAVAGALRQVVQHDGPAVVACVSASQASSWRRTVPVDAILPPYIPTRRIPFSPAPGGPESRDGGRETGKYGPFLDHDAGSGAVFAGRFSPEKGAADAIRIAQLAGIQIDLFGDAYDPEYTHEHIDPWRADPGVAVHPAVPQTSLWDAMTRAAVVLCPAQWEEPFGMVAAEAQACGTPVVAFRRGALPEVIVDGVTGFLVEPGDHRAGAEMALRAPQLSRAACREHAEANLDIERSLDAHERLYERIARASGGRVAGADRGQADDARRSRNTEAGRDSHDAEGARTGA
jgi:glycosyltransferase involved in cell wall biosynthesis